MKKENIIRAWKDEGYRMSLSEAERAMLPENPAGILELSDAQLGAAGGRLAASYLCSFTCTTACSKLCTILTNCPIKSLDLACVRA